MKKIRKCFLVLIFLVLIISGCVAQTREYNSLETVSRYLSETSGGNSVDNPLPLKVNIDLQNMLADESGWKKLLRIINTQGKYIALDLSNSRMSITEFNPDSKFEIGKKYIVSLILPKITETITPTENGWDSRGRFFSSPSFKYFENLTLTISENVTLIDYPGFGSCSSLKSVTFSKGSKLNRIDDLAFYACSNLVSIIIPASVTSIGTTAFTGSPKLANVIFETGSKLEIIEQQAFSGCTSLENIEIPSSVTSIGLGAFQGTGFMSVIIPANVTSIGRWAFSDCSNLVSVTVLAVEPPELDWGVFTIEQVITRNHFGLPESVSFLRNPVLEAIFVPAESVDAYKVAENWKEYSDLIKAK